ncbi:MAG: hypothetical protein AB1489_14125 [Acidobacteriota bacterium]
MMRKPLAIVISFILLIATISAQGDIRDENQVVVNIPGQLEASNNVVFNRDGRYGFIASNRQSDGTMGDQLYAFDSTSGEIIDRRQTVFSPTGITIDKFSSTIVVSGSITEPTPHAQLFILSANDQGKFNEATGMVSVEVPMAKEGDWIPDQVALSNNGYAIFSNKSSLFVFSTINGPSQSLGQIVDVTKVIPAESYSNENRLINIDFDANSNTLAVLWQRSRFQSSILLYRLDAATGKLFPLDINVNGSRANEIVLPEDDVFAPGTNIAFNESASELYITSSLKGILYDYSIKDGVSLTKLVQNPSLAAQDTEEAIANPTTTSYRLVKSLEGEAQPLVFITRSRSINRPSDIRGSINRPSDIKKRISTINVRTAVVISEYVFDDAESISTTLNSNGTIAYIATNNGDVYQFETLTGTTTKITPLSNITLNIALEEETGLLAITGKQTSIGAVNLMKVK